MRISTTRPKSVVLQLHTPSIWIPWPSSPLDTVEQWLISHLPRSAARSGFCLNGLSFAKQDGRWPPFEISRRPLRLSL